MSHPISPRIQTHPNPYDDFDAEITTWLGRPRRWIVPARWECRLTIRPRAEGFWIGMSIGNEYTGLIYGWTEKRARAKAERWVTKRRAEIARRENTETLVVR